MKGKGCAAAGLAGLLVLAAAVAALVGLGALAHRDEIVEDVPPPVSAPPASAPPGSLEPMRPFSVRTAAPPAPMAAPPDPALVPVQPFRVRTAAPPPPASPPPEVRLPPIVPAPPPAPAPSEDVEAFLAEPGEWRLFERREDGSRYHLQYGFVDYAGRRHEVACSIARDAVERASRGFGLDRAELTAEVNDSLQQAVDREIDRRGLRPYVRVVVQDYAGWRWESSSTVGRREDLQALETWLRSDYDRVFHDAEQAAFRRRGLLRRGRTVGIDHNGVARAAAYDLAECYDALVSAGGAASERSFLGLLVAFFQELAYELPPESAGSRDIFGFWVPARVMADGKGDCDSKAVAFASLWRRRSSRVIVVRVPGHALVGVEARPGPGERVVRVGNRYYVLSEVAGPRKRPPGSTDVSGTFEFVAIDP